MGDAGEGSPRGGSTGGLAGALSARDGAKLRFQLLFFIVFVSMSGFIIFRNVYLEEMGLSGSAMGLIGFLMSAAGVAVQPLWGILTDYFRAERTVLVVGATLSGIALLSYPLGDEISQTFLIVAVGTVVFSAARAPIVPIATGMVLDRGLDYGGVRAFGSLAFAVGSLGFGVIVTAFGSAWIVYCYVVGVVATVAIAWSLPASAGSEDEDDDGTPIRTAARALVTNPTFLVVLAAAFLLRFSVLGGEAFFSVYMRGVDASLAVGPWTIGPDGLTGLAWAINSGIEAVAFLYALKTSLSYRWLLAAGGAIMVVPNLVYGLTTAPVILLAVQSLGGIGFAMAGVAAVELAHAAAADRVTATAQSLLTGIGYGLGGAVGQAAAGGLLDAVGLQQMYVAIAAVGFVGAFVALFVGIGDVDGTGRATA